MPAPLDIAEALTVLDHAAGDPCQGLPEEIFLFASRITPLVNVDLLVKNEDAQTLLTWRADGYGKAGWHIPGGIIRYKEMAGDRIRAVARLELGAEVDFHSEPLAVNEFIHADRRVRGHFISLLYRCSLITPPVEDLRYESGIPQPHQWMWHNTCPEDIITVHELYRKFF